MVINANASERNILKDVRQMALDLVENADSHKLHEKGE